jgi:metal-responsive CopG/Arc/MetJ family transcriptional regulator
MRRTSAETEAISIKLPRALSARVSRLAQQRKVSRTEIVRDALEQYLNAHGETEGRELTDLKGCLKGLPRDLSSNPRHLAAYGS